MKALPKTIFVRREEDGDETYLVAGETLREHVNLEDDNVIVGEYRLVQKLEVTVALIAKPT